MRKGVFPTARPHVFNHQLHHPVTGRTRLPLALLAGVLVLSVAASVTPAQEQPQPVPPPAAGADLSELERQFDARVQELEARRTELQHSVQRTETRFQQLLLEQEQQRQQLQKELSDIRARLRDVENQLADLPRQRLRAKYLAALQTLEQTREKRRQTENEAEAARLAEQDASLAVERLRQLQNQMPPSPPAPPCGAPQPQTAAPRIGPGPSESLPALQEPLRTVPPQGQTGDKPGNVGPLGDSLCRGLEGLRGEVRDLGSRVKAVTAQMDTTRETFSREISAVRTDLRRMGQTVGRLEQEHLEAQGHLRTNVEELRGHLEQVRQLCQTRRTLDIALLQAHISTVGSAAYR